MKFSKVRAVKSPVRGTEKSAGIDFFIPDDFKETFLDPSSDILIPSGIKAKIPEGFMLMAENKSGVVTSRMACVHAGREPKKDAFLSVVVVGAKIVDEDYQGEIHIHLVNVGYNTVKLTPGMKIAQFILVPVSYDKLEEVPADELFEAKSERGDGALGSTGSY